MAKKAPSERALRSIVIDEKLNVKIKFVEDIIRENVDDGESLAIENEYQVKAKYKPHKDLTNSLRALLPFALEIAEMEVNAKRLKDYTVSGLKLSGDVMLQKARVVLIMSKLVRRTAKIVTIVTPQVTMYGESEYDNMEKMTKQIEKVIKEAWEYIEGKYQEPDQLPLFKKD